MRHLHVFLVCLILIPLTAAPAAGADNSLPRFESAACPFKIGAGLTEGKDVRCGYLVVPEDRSKPAGPTIRLAVAIFKSRSANPAPDPVFFLYGGPGLGIVQALGSSITDKTASFWVGDRDLVLVDQRGVGASQPALTCREVTALAKRVAGKTLSDAKLRTLALDALRQCHDRLTRSGVDLNAYTTLADAGDIADLRSALGYATVNLYGVSYGTRLALSVMRNYPQGIRSVVLDSVVPPDFNLFTSPLHSFPRAFATLFAGCAQSTACNSRYPNLRRVFYGLVTRLNARPVRVTVNPPDGSKPYKATLTGDALASVLAAALYYKAIIPALPAVIFQTMDGDYTLVSRLLGLFAASGGMDLGMTLSVECSDDAPFTSAQQITVAAQSVPAQIRRGLLKGQLDAFDQCKAWTVKSTDPSQRQAVTSDIPALLLQGEYDPITEPTNAVEVGKTLSHSFSFVYPGVGHWVRLGNDCPNGMIQAFYDDPTHSPDASCIAQMHEPFP